MKKLSVMTGKRIMIMFVALFSLLHVFRMGYVAYTRSVFLQAAAEKTESMRELYTKIASHVPTIENSVLIISAMLFIFMMIYVVICMPKRNIAMLGIAASVLIPAILLFPFLLFGTFKVFDVYFLMIRGLTFGAIVVAIGAIFYYFRCKERKIG